MVRPEHLARAAAALLLTLVTACGSGTDTDSEPEPEPTTADASPTAPASEPLTLVVIGDSIPNNAPEDCPGCTGFVDQYASELEQATGETVEVQNFSDHTGLTVERLLQGLQPLEQYLAEADAIVVGIAHNSNELSSDRPCGRPLTGQGLPQWDAVDAECANAAAARYRPLYDRLFTRVAAVRDGRPTILRSLNRYNDWIGWPEGDLTAAEERRTKVVLDAWNAMLCTSAEHHGFGCADVSLAFNGPEGLAPSGRLVADDYTHPSQRGNDLITDVLVDLGFEPIA